MWFMSQSTFFSHARTDSFLDFSKYSGAIMSYRKHARVIYTPLNSAVMYSSETVVYMGMHLLLISNPKQNVDWNNDLSS